MNYELAQVLRKQQNDYINLKFHARSKLQSPTWKLCTAFYERLNLLRLLPEAPEEVQESSSH